MTDSDFLTAAREHRHRHAQPSSVPMKLHGAKIVLEEALKLCDKPGRVDEVETCVLTANVLLAQAAQMLSFRRQAVQAAKNSKIGIGALT